MTYRDDRAPATPSFDISASPKFRALVRERSRLAWTLAISIMTIFFGFILLVAFDRNLLGKSVAPGWTISLGIPIGFGVIVSGIALTALYVQRANARFDRLTREIREEAGL